MPTADLRTMNIQPVDLGRIAAENGIDVLEADLRRKWSAVLIRWDHGGFEIRVEKTDRLDQKRLALAMTLARFMTVGNALRDFRLERRGELARQDVSRDPAAAAALNMLAPADLVHSAWEISKRNINIAATMLAVPSFVIALRVADLGLLHPTVIKPDLRAAAKPAPGQPAKPAAAPPAAPAAAAATPAPAPFAPVAPVSRLPQSKPAHGRDMAPIRAGVRNRVTAGRPSATAKWASRQLPGTGES